MIPPGYSRLFGGSHKPVGTHHLDGSGLRLIVFAHIDEGQLAMGQPHTDPRAAGTVPTDPPFCISRIAEIQVRVNRRTPQPRNTEPA